MKRFLLLLCALLLLMYTNTDGVYIVLDIGGEIEPPSPSPSELLTHEIPEEIAAPPLLGVADEIAHEAEQYDFLMRQFFDDAKASLRLGDSYANGIGTNADSGKAFRHYIDSALMGDASALYRLSAYTWAADIDLTALYKSASSQNYHGYYFAMVYGGLDGYAADDEKRDLIAKLSDIWDGGGDAPLSNMQRAVKANSHFSAEFVETLIRTSYTYSYHAFAEEYGLRPNRTFEDAERLHFAPYDGIFSEKNEYMAERYLRYDGCQFYEYDFDGFGEDEIGIPIHSGAGGAFSGDGLDIYKKTEDGLRYFSRGPNCSLTDAMRIIRYDGKIYFLVNPLDTTANAPHDIIAYTVDMSGRGHEVSIRCKDYDLRRVITYTEDAFASGYDSLISEIEQQLPEAVAAAKEQRLYSPAGENRLDYEVGDDFWGRFTYNDSYSSPPENIFFSADIHNDGKDVVIHKGHSSMLWKGNFYLNWFQVYPNRGDFDNGTADLHKPVFDLGSFGIQSGGNLNDLLPVGGSVVQFWTHEHGGVTYCITLQRHELLYTLQIFEVRNGEASLVSKSLYFDEAQDVEVTFSLVS